MTTLSSQCIDNALQTEHQSQPPRDYLGASRLGVACDRALQYEFMAAPVDDGRSFTGRSLRIFAADHVFETLAIQWLRQAGFEIHTETSQGEQYDFSVAGRRI